MWTPRTKSLSDLLSMGLQLHSNVSGFFFFFHHLALQIPHTKDGRGERRMRTEDFGIQRETGVMANRLEEPMRGAPQRERGSASSAGEDAFCRSSPV